MRNKILLWALLALTPLPAFAHVSLAENQASPGAQFAAHFRVGHGCSGSPTIALTVVLPDAVQDAAPEPVPGWSITTAHDGDHVVIGWKGGVLASDKPGVFTLHMRLPEKPARLAFVTTQTCQQDQEVWSQLPADDGHHLENPVPLLYVGINPPAPAAGTSPSPLSLSDGWLRLLPGGLPAGGYFTLRNSGSARVVLTAADSPACGMLMLHKSEDTGGMSSMQDVSRIEVPGGGGIAFAPGGYHLMCTNPKPMLQLGANVPVTLSFEGAPPLTARFDVRGATGK